METIELISVDCKDFTVRVTRDASKAYNSHDVSFSGHDEFLSSHISDVARWMGKRVLKSLNENREAYFVVIDVDMLYKILAKHYNKHPDKLLTICGMMHRIRFGNKVFFSGKAYYCIYSRFRDGYIGNYEGAPVSKKVAVLIAEHLKEYKLSSVK